MRACPCLKAHTPHEVLAMRAHNVAPALEVPVGPQERGVDSSVQLSSRAHRRRLLRRRLSGARILLRGPVRHDHASVRRVGGEPVVEQSDYLRHQWQPEVISDNRRSSVANAGPRWQSEVISGDLTCVSSSSRTARAS